MSEQNNQKIKQVKDEYEAKLAYIRLKKSGLYLIPVIYVLFLLAAIQTFSNSSSKILSLPVIVLFIIFTLSLIIFVYFSLEQYRDEEKDAKSVLQKKLDYYSDNTNESNGGEQ